MSGQQDSKGAGANSFVTLLNRVFGVRPGELPFLSRSFLYAFFLFASYGLVKPVREAMGINEGAVHLPHLFLLTMGVMLVAHLLFAGSLSRFQRRDVIPLLYRLIALVLLSFAFLFAFLDPRTELWLARSFYVWVSVYNLFALSVFWGLMADCFNRGEAKRLFALIAAGGTIGGMVGSGVASLTVASAGPVALIILAAVFLEAGVRFSVPVREEALRQTPETTKERMSVFAGALEGFQRIGRSRFLLTICVFMFLYTFTSSVLYFERSNLVESAFSETRERIEFFANLDFLVQSLALVGQLFISGRFIRRTGMAFSLALVPLITAGGFLVLGSMLGLVAVSVFDVARRSVNYSVAKPCREALYAVLEPAEQYKAKSLIDTFIYRGGDALAAVFFALLQERASLSAIALIAVPVSVVWIVTGIYLGRSEEERARSQGKVSG